MKHRIRIRINNNVVVTQSQIGSSKDYQQSSYIDVGRLITDPKEQTDAAIREAFRQVHFYQRRGYEIINVGRMDGPFAIEGCEVLMQEGQNGHT